MGLSCNAGGSDQSCVLLSDTSRLPRREDSDDADEGLGGKRNDLGAEEAQ